MKVLEKDPMVILPFLLGFKSDKYTEENTKKVMDLFDKEKPFDQQLTTLEQAYITFDVLFLFVLL